MSLQPLTVCKVLERCFSSRFTPQRAHPAQINILLTTPSAIEREVPAIKGSESNDRGIRAPRFQRSTRGVCTAVVAI